MKASIPQMFPHYCNLFHICQWILSGPNETIKTCEDNVAALRPHYYQPGLQLMIFSPFPLWLIIWLIPQLTD